MISMARQVLPRIPVPYIEITYEDMLEDFTLVERDVVAFLDQETVHGLNSPLSKVNTRRYCDTIENFQALRDALADTPAKKYME